MADYRLYIDESGNHGWDGNPSNQFLALLGVWFQYAEPYKRFHDHLSQIKADHFPERRDPFVLHREDIRYHKGAFVSLKDPVKRARFDADLVRLVGDHDYKAVCVVIDKKAHAENAHRHTERPYDFCLESMLDRYCGWLRHVGAKGDVAAESRGRKENAEIAAVYRSVREVGTRHFPAPHHRGVLTSDDLHIRTKVDEVGGLQLADILAHPIRRSMLAAKGHAEQPSGFAAKILEAVEPKFNREGATGTTEGYGRVWLA